MSRRRRKAGGMNYLILLIIFIFLLALGLLVAASYYTAKGNELFDRPDGSLRAGAGVWKETQARIQAAEARAKAEEAAREAEEEEEKLPEVDPALRLPNTVDFAALWDQNEDVYAWITIPGTLVDYPILQHPTDDEYYLNHTIDHVRGLPGSIYSEAIHPKDFSAANSILYGHNMKNDTMFGSLHDYESAAFFEEHPYVYIHLPDRTLLYQIFSAVRFSDAYLPEYYNYENEEAFENYIEDLRNSSGFIREGMEVPFGSHLLTLSTCIGNAPHNRFLVAAVLIGEYEKGSSLQ